MYDILNLLRGERTLVSIESLRTIPYFAPLAPADLERFCRLVRVRNYTKNEIIFLEGEPCEGLFLVKSGRVKIYKASEEGREQVLRIMEPGESFNEVPIFDGGPNPASAQAMEDETTLYLVRKEDALALVQGHPEVALAVLRVFATRLRQLTFLVEELSFKHVTERLATILMLYATEPVDVREGACLKHRLTQQELAAMVGTAREVVARGLKSLERAGAIRVERQRIVIVNKQKLARISGRA